LGTGSQKDSGVKSALFTGILYNKVGPDFSSGTLRLLKEKENKQYGEYRTRRLVLEAWDKVELGI